MMKISDVLKRLVSFILVATMLTVSTAPAAQARFLSPDTYDPWMEGVDINRYAYSQDDPINGSDPNGHIMGGPGLNEWMTMSPDERASRDPGIMGGLALGGVAIGALAGPAIIAGSQVWGAGAIMFGTEIVAGEVGITLPAAAGATIVGGKLAFGGRLFSLTDHHIFPQGKTWSALAKALGFNVQSPSNIMKAYQQYGGGHVKYTKDFITEANEILKSNLSTQAKTKAVNALIEKYRNIVKNDPTVLAKTKADLVKPSGGSYRGLSNAGQMSASGSQSRGCRGRDCDR